MIAVQELRCSSILARAATTGGACSSDGRSETDPRALSPGVVGSDIGCRVRAEPATHSPIGTGPRGAGPGPGPPDVRAGPGSGSRAGRARPSTGSPLPNAAGRPVAGSFGPTSVPPSTGSIQARGASPAPARAAARSRTRRARPTPPGETGGPGR